MIFVLCLVALCNANLCDDYNACTKDMYDVFTGKCSHSEPNPCVDNNACTTDFCDPSTGKCRHYMIICDDGDVCTNDTCNATTGKCMHSARPPCDDNNSCTDDYCDSMTGSCRNIMLPKCLVTPTTAHYRYLWALLCIPVAMCFVVCVRYYMKTKPTDHLKKLN